MMQKADHFQNSNKDCSLSPSHTPVVSFLIHLLIIDRFDTDLRPEPETNQRQISITFLS